MGARKAKNAPVKKATIEIPHIHQLSLRKLAQARACLGSAGQGMLRARHIMMPASIIMMAAAAKTQILYREIQTMAGKELVSPANVAPIPSDTKRAGRAQHISVPAEVKRLSEDGRRCLKLKFSDIKSQSLYFFALACVMPLTV